MHHQKTGGNRNAGRNTVSVSVAVLLALVMLAAGVCGGFLLTREPEPAAFESTTRAGTLVVQSEPYDDERSVTVTVERSESGSVAAPVGGVVTELRQCASGSSIESGSAFIAVDGQPQLALYLRTPPYRMMTSGMKGGDVAALNAELRRLGYTAPDSDVMTWDTVKAFNALARTRWDAERHAGAPVEHRYVVVCMVAPTEGDCQGVPGPIWRACRAGSRCADDYQPTGSCDVPAQ